MDHHAQKLVVFGCLGLSIFWGALCTAEDPHQRGSAGLELAALGRTKRRVHSGG